MQFMNYSTDIKTEIKEEFDQDVLQSSNLNEGSF